MTKEEYVKDLIRQQGYSVKEFATKINIPYTTLLSILNRSVSGASLDNIIKICDGLNIEVDKLKKNMFSVKDKIILNDKEMDLIKKYRALDERGKKAIDDNLAREYEFAKSN